MHLSPSAPSCFIEPPVGMVTEVMRCHMKFQHPEGDHFTLINIYNTFKRSQKEPCERRSSSHECPGEERECVKHLCVCVCQISVRSSGVRSTSCAALLCRQQTPSELNSQTSSNASSFPFQKQPSAPKPTHSTSRERCSQATSCRSENMYLWTYT